MIRSQRYVVSARMFIDVCLGLKVGSVPIVCTASSHEIGGTGMLGIGAGTAGGGTTPTIGVSPFSDDVMMFFALLLANYLTTCCYCGWVGVVGQIMVSPFSLGVYTVSLTRTSN